MYAINYRLFFLSACLLTLALACWPHIRATQSEDDSPWSKVQHVAPDLEDPLTAAANWNTRDVNLYQSSSSPGILIRMRTASILFFAKEKSSQRHSPTVAYVKTSQRVRSLKVGESLNGAEMTASWIVASYQRAQGWEDFDVPWFLSLDKRPRQISLTQNGLSVQFDLEESGHIFSMPLFGYYKLPQPGYDFAAQHNLPSKGLRPWEWVEEMPAHLVERCDWWASVAKAFPVAFQESFQVDASLDRITFRQRYGWKIIEDDWGTTPTRFAALSPPVALAWQYRSFPMEISEPIHDPDYFTAFGPYVGVIDVDQIDISMPVLHYINELETIGIPDQLSQAHVQAIEMIRQGMQDKFGRSTTFSMDHGGPENYCWNIVGDIWYLRGLQFVPESLRQRAAGALEGYFKQMVLQPAVPFHGKYLIHGPGIGSWGQWGDAGKFSTNSLQAIWGYGQFVDWDLISQNWDLIKRFFVTPEEADWLTFGRSSIAEMGDEAAPCSSYARMAWAVGDQEEYLFGAYMFARELIHHYIKQKGGSYFYQNQPHNHLFPMPEHVYPTHLATNPAGWSLDGPYWPPRAERQSINRWIRFQDPDTARFYREYLLDEVRSELDWYVDVARQESTEIPTADTFRKWLQRDVIHLNPSMARLRSFLLGEPYSELKEVVDLSNYGGRRGSAIAVGYSYLRSMSPINYERVVPSNLEASPFVLGLQRHGLEETTSMVQLVRQKGVTIESVWPSLIEEGQVSRRHNAPISFGLIRGDFPGTVTGAEGEHWISYGSYVYWADAIQPRQLTNVSQIVQKQDQTPVSIIGPFPNPTDTEILSESYPPEEEIRLTQSYPGAGKTVSWHSSRLQKGRRIQISRESAGGTEDSKNTINYVLQCVESPREMDVYLVVGSGGGVQAWMNQQPVISHHGLHLRRLMEDRLKGIARLTTGRNRLLIKAEGLDGRFDLQFRLAHLDRQPIPELQFVVCPD